MRRIHVQSELAKVGFDVFQELIETEFRDHAGCKQNTHQCKLFDIRSGH